MIKVQPKESNAKASHNIPPMTHERVVINTKEQVQEEHFYEDDESTFSETLDGLDSCSEVSSVPVPNFKPPPVPRSIRSLRQLGMGLKH